MSAKNSTLLHMIYELRERFVSGVVSTFNGRSGKITLTSSDIQSAIAPNNFIVGSGIKKITVSNVAPSSPEVGDVWIDTSTDVLT